MPDTETFLSEARRRASRRRRWYAVAIVLVVIAVAAPVGVLTHHGGHREQPLSERALAVRAMQRAHAQENIAIQAHLRALAAAKR